MVAKLFVIACWLLVAQHVAGFGIITDTNVSAYLSVDAITAKGSICLLRDLDTQLCLENWSSAPQNLSQSTLGTDVDAFTLQGSQFLMVTRASNNSLLYKWNATASSFGVVQTFVPGRSTCSLFLNGSQIIAIATSTAVFIFQADTISIKFAQVQVIASASANVTCTAAGNASLLVVATSTAVDVYTWNYTVRNMTTMQRMAAGGPFVFVSSGNLGGTAALMVANATSSLLYMWSAILQQFQPQQAFSYSSSDCSFGNASNTAILVTTSLVSGQPAVWSWNATAQRFQLSANLSLVHISGVYAMSIQDQSYFIASNGSISTVMQLDVSRGLWTGIQNVTSAGPTWKSFSIGKATYLLQVSSSSSQSSILYRWGVLLTTFVNNSVITGAMHVGNAMIPSSACPQNATASMAAGITIGITNGSSVSYCTSLSVSTSSVCSPFALFSCTISTSGLSAASSQVVAVLNNSNRITISTAALYDAGPLSVQAPFSLASVRSAPVVGSSVLLTVEGVTGSGDSIAAFTRGISLDGSSCSLVDVSSASIVARCSTSNIWRTSSVIFRFGGQLRTRISPILLPAVRCSNSTTWKANVTVTAAQISSASSLMLMGSAGTTSYTCVILELVTTDTAICAFLLPPPGTPVVLNLTARFLLFGAVTFVSVDLGATILYRPVQLSFYPPAPLARLGGAWMLVTLPSPLVRSADWMRSNQSTPVTFDESAVSISLNNVAFSNVSFLNDTTILAITPPVEGVDAQLTVQLGNTFNFALAISDPVLPPDIFDASPSILILNADPSYSMLINVNLSFIADTSAPSTSRIYNVSIGGAFCKRLTVVALGILQCTGLNSSSLALHASESTGLSITMAWGNTWTDSDFRISVGLQPQILRVLPCATAGKGTRMFLTGRFFGDSLWGLMPVVKFANALCTNVTMVYNLSWDSIECDAPDILPNSVATYPVIPVTIINGAKVASATSQNVTYPNGLTVAWSGNSTTYATLPSGFSNTVKLIPPLVIDVFGQSQTTCFLQLVSAKTICNTNASGLDALEDAMMVGMASNSLAFPETKLVFDSVGVRSRTACVHEIIATCVDSQGQEATTTGRRQVTISGLDFTWITPTQSNWTVLPLPLPPLVISSSLSQLDTGVVDGIGELLACDVAIASISENITDRKSLRSQISGGTVFAGRVTVPTANRVYVNFTTLSAEACPLGQQYRLYCECVWLPTSERFVLPPRDFLVPNATVSLVYAGSPILDGYSPFSLGGSLNMTVAGFDFSQASGTCSLDTNNTAIRLAGAQQYTVSAPGVLVPALQAEIMSPGTETVALQLSLTCTVWAKQLASPPLVLTVARYVITPSSVEPEGWTWPSGLADSVVQPIHPLNSFFVRARGVLTCAVSVTASQCPSITVRQQYGFGLGLKTGTCVVAGNSSYGFPADLLPKIRTLILSGIGLQCSSACNVTLLSKCKDGSFRTASKELPTVHLPAFSASWLDEYSFEDVIFPPTLPPLTAAIRTFPATPMSSPVIVDKVSQWLGRPRSLADKVGNASKFFADWWTCSALILPSSVQIDLSATLASRWAVASFANVIAYPVSNSSWEITFQDVACPSCKIGFAYKLESECVYTPTFERIRLEPISISMAMLNLTWDAAAALPVELPPVELPDIRAMISSPSPSFGTSEDAFRFLACEVVVVLPASTYSDTFSVLQRGALASSTMVVVRTESGWNASATFIPLSKCNLAAQYAVIAECAWLPTGQRIRSPVITFATPAPAVIWAGGVPERWVRGYETVVVEFLLANLSSTASTQPAIQCGLSSNFTRSTSRGLVATAWYYNATQSDISSVFSHSFRVDSPAGLEGWLSMSCRIWNKEFTSTIPLRLYLVTYDVQPVALPLHFIPSDASAFVPLDPSIVVKVKDALGVMERNVTCTLSLATLGGAAQLLLESGTSVSSVHANSNGEVVMPPVAIQASFATTSTNLTVICRRDVGESIAKGHTWSVAIVPLRMAVCAPPVKIGKSQQVLPSFSVAVSQQADTTACNSAALVASPITLPSIPCFVVPFASTESIFLQGISAQVVPSISSLATFPNFVVTAKHGLHYDFNISCSIGSTVIPDPFTFSLELEGCGEGTMIAGVFCNKCGGSKFSFGGANASCIDCPAEGVVCNDGKLVLLPYYYSPLLLTPGSNITFNGDTELHPCLNTEACVVNITGRTYSCFEGYTGPLCSVCDAQKDYARFGQACRPCWAPAVSLLFVLVVSCIILASLAIVALVNVTQMSDAGIALRILMSYVQAIGSLRVFQAGGTRAYHELMDWTETVSTSPLSFGALQCLWRPPFLLQLGVTISLPLLAAGIVVGIFISATLVRVLFRNSTPVAGTEGDAAQGPASVSWSRRYSRHVASDVRKWLEQRRHWATLLFVLYLCYMPITSAALKALDCHKPIANVRYLDSDMQVQCYVGQHAAAVVIAYLVLAFVGLGFPLSLIVYLGSVSGATVRSQAFHLTWGFLSDGYRMDHAPKAANETTTMVAPLSNARPKRMSRMSSASLLETAESINKSRFITNIRNGRLLWWEACVLLRQAGIVLLAVLVSNPYVQSVGASLLLTFFLAAQLIFKPYIKPLFNHLSAIGLAAGVATAIISTTLLQYDVTTPAFVSQAPAEMTTMQWGITGLLAVINFLTLALLTSVWLGLQFPMSMLHQVLNLVLCREHKSLDKPVAAVPPASPRTPNKRMSMQTAALSEFVLNPLRSPVTVVAKQSNKADALLRTQRKSVARIEFAGTQVAPSGKPKDSPEKKNFPQPAATEVAPPRRVGTSSNTRQGQSRMVAGDFRRQSTMTNPLVAQNRLGAMPLALLQEEEEESFARIRPLSSKGSRTVILKS